MQITQATTKGQVLIPVGLRRKYQIHRGSRLAIIDREGEIVIKPLKDDPVQYGHGLIKKGSSALKALIKERQSEAKR